MHTEGDAAAPGQPWFALVIGNSRLHWGRFVGDALQATWDEAHWQPAAGKDFEQHVVAKLGSLERSLWIASVVPAQSNLWAKHPHAQFLTLDQVPLQGLYPTLGIDRALAVWGAIALIGSPALVIDCGTALTFTGADAQHHLVGGAILPGLRLQFEALGQNTALLPTLSTASRPVSLPPYWAQNTQDAIASGILHTVTAGIQAFIQAWWQHYPESPIVMTGGDSHLLYHCLQALTPEVANQVILDNHLIFQAICTIKTLKEAEKGHQAKGSR